MGGDCVNAITVLGREILLVEVGWGAETHLAEAGGTATPGPAGSRCRAIRRRESLVHRDSGALRRGGGGASVGRDAAVRSNVARDGGRGGRHHVPLAGRLVRSHLPVVPARGRHLVPPADAPAGVELLAVVIADGVEEFGRCRSPVTRENTSRRCVGRRAGTSGRRASGPRPSSSAMSSMCCPTMLTPLSTPRSSRRGSIRPRRRSCSGWRGRGAAEPQPWGDRLVHLGRQRVSALRTGRRWPAGRRAYSGLRPLGRRRQGNCLNQSLGWRFTYRWCWLIGDSGSSMPSRAGT